MTRAEAIRQVLEDLRVIDAVSEPAAEDFVRVGRRADQERARLMDKGLVWWDADSIPDAVAGAFCDLVALQSIGAFPPKPGSPQFHGTPEWEWCLARAQARLASLKSTERREPVRATYF